MALAEVARKRGTPGGLKCACEYCGLVFSYRPHKGRIRRFCSFDHANKAQPRKVPSRDVLFGLYYIKRLTTGQIALRYGCNRKVIWRAVKRAGIPPPVSASTSVAARAVSSRPPQGAPAPR